MKRTLLVLLMALPVVAFSQKGVDDVYGPKVPVLKKGNLKALSEKRGFKNVILGSNSASLNYDLIPFSSKDLPAMNGVDLYQIKDTGLLRVGENIQLTNLVVGVFKGAISAIYLFMDSPNGEYLFKTFEHAYGNVHSKPNQFIDEYFWRAKDVLLYIKTERIGAQIAVFKDVKLQDQIDKYEKEQAKKNSNDL